MKTRLKERLAELAAIPSISGAEQHMARAMYRMLEPLADDIHMDSLGNVYATRHGPDDSSSLMIAAHADEVGGIVTAILPTGFLRFQTIGMVSLSTLFATRVLVGDAINGVIGAPPAYLRSPSENSPQSARALFIDVGARSAAEAREWGIREGDQITFANSMGPLGMADRVCGKAFDDRIGCAILVELLASLADTQLPLTVHAVTTVQEEVTMSGIAAAAHRLQPDLALVVDTVPSDDAPDTAMPQSYNISIGKGVVFQIAEGVPHAYRGAFTHPGILRLLIDTAVQEGVPYQLSAHYGYWTTDGSALQSSGLGVPCGFVSIPRRYAHSPSEVLDMEDAVAALRILTVIVRETGTQVDLRFVADLD